MIGKITKRRGSKMETNNLDNIVYRMGLGTSRAEARQIVRHGHILVNGKKVNIPSYSVKPGDVISVKENSMEHKAILNSLELFSSSISYNNLFLFYTFQVY